MLTRCQERIDLDSLDGTSPWIRSLVHLRGIAVIEGALLLDDVARQAARVTITLQVLQLMVTLYLLLGRGSIILMGGILSTIYLILIYLLWVKYSLWWIVSHSIAQLVLLGLLGRRLHSVLDQVHNSHLVGGAVVKWPIILQVLNLVDLSLSLCNIACVLELLVNLIAIHHLILNGLSSYLGNLVALLTCISGPQGLTQMLIRLLVRVRLSELLLLQMMEVVLMNGLLWVLLHWPLATLALQYSVHTLDEVSSLRDRRPNLTLAIMGYCIKLRLFHIVRVVRCVIERPFLLAVIIETQ